MSKASDRDGSVVTGQWVTESKVQRARQLRRLMTEEEAMLWQQLRGGRFNGLHFRRQQIIDGFIVDFYCHRARLVVEVDGDVHELQSDYDRERDRILSARHLRVIRIKNREIRQDLPNVLAHIASEAGFR